MWLAVFSRQRGSRREILDRIRFHQPSPGGYFSKDFHFPQFDWPQPVPHVTTISFSGFPSHRRLQASGPSFLTVRQRIKGHSRSNHPCNVLPVSADKFDRNLVSLGSKSSVSRFLSVIKPQVGCRDFADLLHHTFISRFSVKVKAYCVFTCIFNAFFYQFKRGCPRLVSYLQSIHPVQAAIQSSNSSVRFLLLNLGRPACYSRPCLSQQILARLPLLALSFEGSLEGPDSKPPPPPGSRLLVTPAFQ